MPLCVCVCVCVHLFPSECTRASQECVFEQLEVKQNVFQDIEHLVGADVILSSSTSCLVPSDVFSKVQNKSRCLVSHPVSAAAGLWAERRDFKLMNTQLIHVHFIITA